MKQLLPFFFCCFFITVPAQADDCTLQTDQLKPFMTDSADVKSHDVEMDEGGHGLTETTILKNGMKIVYTVGGCEHYAFTYSFENVPGGIPAEPDDPFALALSLLDKIPVKDQSELDVLRRGLKEQQKTGRAVFDNNVTQYSCGDAYCSLKLEAGTLAVGYDFAI